MLIAYLVCLLAGGVLISLSLDNESGFDGEGGYLSLLFSTPFWSFGLTGFGLCGVLMLLLSPEESWLPQSLVALAMGTLMGWAASRLLSILGRQDADSLLHTADLVFPQRWAVALRLRLGLAHRLEQ